MNTVAGDEDRIIRDGKQKLETRFGRNVGIFFIVYRSDADGCGEECVGCL